MKKEAKIDRTNVTTRELIMQKTLEIVNDRGMADFRVDLLSSTLGLSPGNITYHFAKKEDLCRAIWVEFYVELKGVEVLVSNLLDVKQSFLVVRSITALIYKYRGVILYRGSDMVVLYRDDNSEYSIAEKLREIIRVILFHLNENGYISQEKNTPIINKIVMDDMFVNMRFWINKEYLMSDSNKYSSISSRVVENSIEILYLLYPLLNERGRAEFDIVCDKML
ncbi:MAG: TetR/AcrR family transcriptional regulator [Rikenellaceae bacterium]